MRFGWVMDHFLYLPSLGLLGLTVAALGRMEERLSASARPCAMGGIAVVAALLAFGSHRYAKIYINSEALWTYTIQRYPDAWPAHNNLGNALLDADRLPEAKVQYDEALRINPDYPEAHNNLGIILAKMGRLSEAIDQFEQALKLCPDLASARDNLAKVQNARQTVPATK
jgi:tetratricopeptide (TPR) repeat protein